MAIRISITERGVNRIARTVHGYATRTNRAVKRAGGKLAQDLRKDIVTGIKRQAPGGIEFKPLKEATKAAKGSSKALINHGDLLRSINVTKAGDLAWFVGVHRSVVAPNGQPMVNIAEVHEFGSKDGRIPERSYLRTSFRAWSYGAEARFARMVAKQIGVSLIRRPISTKTGITFGSGGT